jgi:hypothetical protein
LSFCHFLSFFFTHFCRQFCSCPRDHCLFDLSFELQTMSRLIHGLQTRCLRPGSIIILNTFLFVLLFHVFGFDIRFQSHWKSAQSTHVAISITRACSTQEDVSSYHGCNAGDAF